MADPRVEKLAKVLVQYSHKVKEGERIGVLSPPLANELNLAIYKEIILAGGLPSLLTQPPGTAEILLKYGSDEQISDISPMQKLVIEEYDGMMLIWAASNTRALSGIPPQKQALARKAQAPLFKRMNERVASGEARWTGALFPTAAQAQEADMSLTDYEDFVYKAGKLEEDDPVKEWRKVEQEQQRLIDWLAGKNEIVLRGQHIDLRMNIAGRSFINACGKQNFPDGEIFTSPVEDSANGWVRFGYPAIFGGREVNDIELWFEDGKVVKEKAQKGEEFLTTILNTDDGSRFLGELGIGTNYDIQRFTKHMLFDEKIGGTIHLAVGSGFPKAGGLNNSGVHWDMLCNMAEGEILADGELFYRDGKFAV